MGQMQRMPDVFCEDGERGGEPSIADEDSRK